MAKNRPGSGQVRIIAGQWRSRKLPIQDLEGLRPTTDRVRETLFNWLAGELSGSSVLDCFGGSGALALEALSRYAAFARVYELQKTAAQQLQQNLQTLKCDSAEVINGDVLAGLARPADRRFDIVFIDPPFRKGLAEQTLTLLARHQWLNPGALIYLEVESELQQLPIPADWEALKEKQAGQVSYRLYRVPGGAES
ncbi:MAG: 16S rRNA (guanine(966)-N(2))-methyltransferase RsmD [Shewanella indica]|jgi:16S rRNA (guanine966-N2)-methyltransferase|uniref:16S rRNA (guanine(966)-N(2))-methyltransferase RsmD n=1 Tax=Shewanella TaxID=22 RepID=UPI000579DB81|nr:MULTISPECIES: 16S rRNA (guanine(966)-N(2))-methyltransferase RsmD [Shewanella]MBO2567149.1 16S rRNA (guanine(966)-N(2))-methyltransferase RsmD [Shewanella algae]MBZ4678359.1 rRNA ((966)-N(2))-methyltransferase RsmD [Shewanella sp.]MCE9851015.1 16S rRNA (guanine(966)-N(2))-methyltransferase RsmD [Shewanella chilikensis]QWL02853.1 16S rRNA (guanine(966)-N(2))-methyltransferase RsmD [Shewanella indica]BCV38538.1 ribosomal RNA small subunit methyltransferase D [Shewanella chilikensis]